MYLFLTSCSSSNLFFFFFFLTIIVCISLWHSSEICLFAVTVGSWVSALVVAAPAPAETQQLRSGPPVIALVQNSRWHIRGHNFLGAFNCSVSCVTRSIMFHFVIWFAATDEFSFLMWHNINVSPWWLPSLGVRAHVSPRETPSYKSP